MRAVVTRVSRAAVIIDGVEHSKIEQGFLVLLGVTHEDTESEAKYLAEKCAGLRVFEDENGKMNKSLADIGGAILAVSNFTLFANCAHGRRPDFLAAARPEVAEPLYNYFVKSINAAGVSCKTGVFGADMKIDHINDGPITIIMDTSEMQNRTK